MDTEKSKNTKKNTVKDEISSPEARAERLKRVRNMANLSRKEICDTKELNINTYKGWEIARYGGLPFDGAHKIIKRIATSGVICPVDWLLYGKAPEPYIIPQFNNNEATLKMNNDSGGEERILHEIMFFQSQFNNTIYTKVVDDGLSPMANIDDYVAGIRYFENDINKCLGQDCIIQTCDGAILVRQMKKGREEDTYMLVCTNIQTSVRMPVLYNIKIDSAAPILRVYRSERVATSTLKK